MDFPDFFAAAPAIVVRDPLAAFLGVSATGQFRYVYADAVRLAGHSCPTVAGTWLMLHRGLRHLYGDEVPERGCIEVHMRDARDAGVTGVMASVATLVTGAAPDTGFGGIGMQGRFVRRDLLQFLAPIEGTMALRRMDTGRGVELDLDTSQVPTPKGMPALFPLVLAGAAAPEDATRFGQMWQARVAEMLTQHADDDALVPLRDWSAETNAPAGAAQ